MTPEELGIEIRSFSAKSRSLLFAGAGVSARVGMPTWEALLNGMAGVCREFHDSLSADLILDKVSQGDYLGAAAVYKLCTKIPIGVRLARIADTFSNISGDINQLKSLSKLPFSGMLTTNYDRVLHTAIATFRNISPLQIELGDETMKYGAGITEFFVARIHGRYEVPSSIVLDSSDYDKLKINSTYRDFLTQILRQRPTLFIGFSFFDPAIQIVLDTYKAAFGPNFPEMHLAIIPDGHDKRLLTALSEVNIQVLTYDPNDLHKNLWRSIRVATEVPAPLPEQTHADALIPKDLPNSCLHRMIAFTFAQSSTPDHIRRPALEMVQDGALLSVLDEWGGGNVDKISVVESLRQLLGIEKDQAVALFEQSSRRLLAAGQIRDLGKYISKAATNNDSFDKTLNILASGTTDRVKILKGITLEPRYGPLLKELWENLFIIRSWDLAPQYAGSMAIKGVAVEETISSLLQGKGVPVGVEKALLESFLHVIRHPDNAQATALAEMSRTAITVQILLASPRQTIAHAYTLPTKIYFDASVLLPAIIPGHPMHHGYLSAIKRLKSAAKNARQKCEFEIRAEFLEEILKHREKAIELVKQLKLEEPVFMAKHISFYGAENTNVYVGAFSSLFKRGETSPHSFSAFLFKIAPYRNEKELIAFLQQEGFKAEMERFFYKNHSDFSHIFNHLLSGYEQALSFGKNKDRVLIQHEALQLTQLSCDAASGIRSLFVTADRRLQRIIHSTKDLEKLTGSVISELGFIGLVDLLVGLGPDKEIFTRLMWAMPRTNVQRQIRDYLVTTTLNHYDDAMALAMPTVLDEILSSEQYAIEANGEQFRKATSTEDAKSASEFLDRLQDEYFEKMRKTIERREKSAR